MENRPNETTPPDSNPVNPADSPLGQESSAASPPPMETHETPPPPLSETPPAYGSPPPMTQATDSEQKNWALGAHLSTLSWYIGVPGFIGPLVIYLIKKDTMAFAAGEAKEALNFQISISIYALVCFLTIFLIIPVLLLIGIAVAHVIFTILAAIEVSNGKAYRYPATIRLVK